MGNNNQSLPSPANFGHFLNSVEFYTPEEVQQFREIQAQQVVFDARAEEWSRPAFHAKYKALQDNYRNDPSQENFDALNGMPQDVMAKHYEEMASANHYANERYLREHAKGLYKILVGRARKMAEMEVESLRSNFQETFRAYGVTYSEPLVVGALISFAQRVGSVVDHWDRTGILPRPHQLFEVYLPPLPEAEG